jgi:hypothetical protein
MQQPNIHLPSPAFFPIQMRALLQSSTKTQSEGHGSLKKVTGLKSLNMELSWTPFPKVPTNEEVANVDGDIRDNSVELSSFDNAKLSPFLQQAAISSNVVNYVFRGWDSLENSAKPSELGHAERFDVMLTREDRRRLGRVLDDIEDSDQADSYTVSIVPHPFSDLRVDEEKQDVEFQGLLPEESAKNVRSEWDTGPLDDSGVSFAQLVNIVDNDDLDQNQCVDGEDFPRDADKENMPPLPDPDFWTSQLPFGPQDSDSEYNRLSSRARIEYPAYETFVPLSFDSSHGHSNYPSQPHTIDQEMIDDERPSRNANLDESSTSGKAPPQHRVVPKFSVPQLSEPIDVVMYANLDHHESESTLDGHLTTTDATGTSLANFLALRNKYVTQDSLNLLATPQAVDSEDVSGSVVNETPIAAQVTPEGILDCNTLLVPSPWFPASTPHRYLASVEILQKRSIVRSLGSPECAVDLVERDTLGGVDLVLDPHTAVIFASLMALPSQCETLTARIGQQSWRYSRLLVIFEAFSASLAYKSDQASAKLAPNPYTPPILKAVKKLRRDLGIAEALETKNAGSLINFAFADDTHEAALFTRIFGDRAEENDTTRGAIWGPRRWLDGEEQEARFNIIIIIFSLLTGNLYCTGGARSGQHRWNERVRRIFNSLPETAARFFGLDSRNQSS